jgi:hypothetical protein
MKTLARAKLAAAIGTALTAVALSAPVMAVSHSDTGLGEVGLIPYYTTRDGYVTNISVVNTSAVYVAAFKIRFLEGANSRDARDFNVFLSPNDVWTATVSLGEDGVPFIQTADTSCTAPWNSANRETGFVVVGETEDGREVKQMDFTNIAYSDPPRSIFPVDGGPTTIERAQEGHVEIIAMGVADPEFSALARLAVHPGQQCADLARVYAPVNNTIVVTGSGPLECHTDTAFLPGDIVGGNDAFRAEFCEPLNVLKVSADLMSVEQGVSSGLPISMLSNFFNPNTVEDPVAPAPQDLMDQPEFPTPNLDLADPPLSTQVANGDVVEEEFFTSRPVNAVSSLFAATDVINEYAIGGAADAQNAWVVTFPTKHLYVDTFYSAIPNPFQRMFAGSSCVTVNFDYFDRDERGPSTPPGEILPSPPPIFETPSNSICEEAQTINFSDSALLGSQHNYVVPLEDDFTSGWMRLGFPEAGVITSDANRVFSGLPVIGFSLKTLDNGVAGPFALNYGIISAHAYLRNIQ